MLRLKKYKQAGDKKVLSEHKFFIKGGKAKYLRTMDFIWRLLKKLNNWAIID